MNRPKPEHSETERLADWVDRYGPSVRGYLRAMVRHDDEADDLAQEVFRRAWTARHRYRENGTARAYLLKIADRLVCDRARRRREVQLPPEQWPSLEPETEAFSPSANLEQQELKTQLETALDQLSDDQRRVLLLRYYGDMTFAQIAQIMDCPLNTALSHCRRGLLALRAVFQERLS